MSDKFQEIVPWLANGTLSPEESAWAQVELEKNDSARASLKWERMLRSAIQEDAEGAMPPPRLLDEVIQRIELSRPAPKVVVKAASKHSGINKFLLALVASVQRAPAFAVACGLLIVQFGLIGHLLSSRETDNVYRGIQARHQASQFIRLMFKPDITEKGLRELLQNVDADIVSGPTQLGDYFLWVEPTQMSSILKTLRSDPRIESAEIVNTLPEQP